MINCGAVTSPIRHAAEQQAKERDTHVPYTMPAAGTECPCFAPIAPLAASTNREHHPETDDHVRRLREPPLPYRGAVGGLPKSEART